MIHLLGKGVWRMEVEALIWRVRSGNVLYCKV